MANEIIPTVELEIVVGVDAGNAWKFWTDPQAIQKWNFASDEWHCPAAENDLTPGGKFSYRMEARDGSMGFDFWGIYTQIETGRKIEYELGDGRKVVITFQADGEKTRIRQVFEIEDQNSRELQEQGWMAIMQNFRKHAEGQ